MFMSPFVVMAIPGYLQFTLGVDFQLQKAIGAGGAGSVYLSKPCSLQLRERIGGDDQTKIVAKKMEGKH